MGVVSRHKKAILALKTTLPLLFLFLSSSNLLLAESDSKNHVVGFFKKLGLLPNYYDKNYVDQLAKKYHEDIEKNPSCSSYTRGSRKSPFSLDYLRLFAHNAAKHLCSGSFSENGTLKLYSQKATSYKGAYTDVLKKIPGVSHEKFSSNGNKSTAALYSMSLALSMDETDGNPLAPKHTGSSHAHEWEAGLGHLSANALYSEVLAPKDGVEKGPKQKPMRNLLKNYAEKIDTALNKAESVSSKEEKASAEYSLSIMCGYSYFTEDYWKSVSRLVAKTEFPDGSPIMVENKEGKLESQYTPARGMRELRNVNLKEFVSKLEAAIEKETIPSKSDKKADDKNTPNSKVLITEKFLKTEEGLAFTSTFRHLMWYCPNLAIELQGLSLRLNSTHQGSISRNELKPHCASLFEDIFKNEAKVCINAE